MPESDPNVVLLFSPFRLIFVVGWLYLCIYTVVRVEYSPLISNRYRGLASVVSLLIGPFLMTLLVVTDISKKLQDGEITPDEIFSTILGYLLHWEKQEHVKKKKFIELMDSSGKSFSEVYGSQSKDTEATRKTLDLTERIIYDAVVSRASDILIDPNTARGYTIRFRVDGFLRVMNKVEDEKCVAVINSIKAISSMDIAEKRRPQDGSFMAKTKDANIYFRVATAGVMGGEKITIRILNQTAGMLRLEEIGMTSKNLKIISEAIKQPSGMILLCGPTGSGKTTSLYAMLNQIDFYTRNVVTVEDPVEYVLAGTSQIEVNVKANITFANALRSILRQDPDVIVAGEIRDAETAAMAMQASQTGHLVLATLHSSSNLATLVRLQDLGIKPLLLSSALSVVISQRLVRKLCEHCKHSANLTESQIAEFKSRGVGLDHVMTAKGCDKCGGTGYYGRSAIMDVMVLDEEIKAILADGRLSAGDLKQKGDTRGRTALKREGMKKVLMGITTIEEVKRVTTRLE
ncbi:MAG: type II/IV secretion system protein [Sedimentisphaerales bacterium]|nr:type II/IV secretion system protein [Sedimentisphaerales bacterium]